MGSFGQDADADAEGSRLSYVERGIKKVIRATSPLPSPFRNNSFHFSSEVEITPVPSPPKVLFAAEVQGTGDMGDDDRVERQEHFTVNIFSAFRCPAQVFSRIHSANMICLVGI